MSFKYLLSFIDDHSAVPNNAGGSVASTSGSSAVRAATPKHATAVDTADLKQILTDAKEGLEIKNTTNEFFETLERITMELRGMTEHSTAFLNRVRKSDAPDYYNVITTPMDLGTVLKKVKASQYKDKAAFKADLDLIWDNCYTYNTLPSHPLRKSAGILRNRADHLLEFVTDPVAAPPPPLHRPSAFSHFNRSMSRLDALDASHTVNSTAGTYLHPSSLLGDDLQSALNGTPETAYAIVPGRGVSVDVMDHDNTNILRPASEDGLFSDEEDDFQDHYEDEEDDSIKTRKGLTSLKSHPGGGRNLHLLQGVAAQNEPSVLSNGTVRHGSLDPADALRHRSHSPLSRDRASSSSALLSIPNVPGTYPGQGNALVARRATANHNVSHVPRERKPQRRTPSLPPPVQPASFSDRMALQRTPENMAKFSALDEQVTRLELNGPEATEAYRTATSAEKIKSASPKALQRPVEATAIMAPLASLCHSPMPEIYQNGHDPHLSQGQSQGQMVRSRSRSMLFTIDGADMLYWQAVSSDSLARAGLPAVPFTHASPQKPPDPIVVSRLLNGSQKPSVFRKDLAKIQTIKRLHRRIHRLRRPDSDVISASTSSDEQDEDSDDETKLLVPDQRMKSLFELPQELLDATLAMGAADQEVHSFCRSMCQHTGFDRVRKGALATMTSMVVQYLQNLGKTAAFYRERHGRHWSSAHLITKILADNSLHNNAGDATAIDPIRRYIRRTLPRKSERITSLAERLQETYLKELDVDISSSDRRIYVDENLIGNDTNEDDDDEDNDNYRNIMRITVMSEHDHYRFEDLGISGETAFDLRELRNYTLRKLFHNELDVPLPFDPPPPTVPLSADGIRHQIGLLRPFLQARRLTSFDLWDDDDAPTGHAADEVRRVVLTRPEVSSSSGRVLIGKRKREIGTGASAPSALSQAGPSAASASIANGLGIGAASYSQEPGKMSVLLPAPLKRIKSSVANS